MLTKRGWFANISERFAAQGKPKSCLWYAPKKVRKNLKKGVDKENGLWYSIKAVREDGMKAPESRRMRELKKVRKNLKKALDKGKRVC